MSDERGLGHTLGRMVGRQSIHFVSRMMGIPRRPRPATELPIAEFVVHSVQSLRMIELERPSPNPVVLSELGMLEQLINYHDLTEEAGQAMGQPFAESS